MRKIYKNLRISSKLGGAGTCSLKWVSLSGPMPCGKTFAH